MHAILSKDGKIYHVILDCIKQGNDFLGSNIKLSDIKFSEKKTERKTVNQNEYKESIEIISKLDSMSFPELKEHVNTSIKDLASAKEVILLLAESLKACIEIQNYDLKKGK